MSIHKRVTDIIFNEVILPDVAHFADLTVKFFDDVDREDIEAVDAKVLEFTDVLKTQLLGNPDVDPVEVEKFVDFVYLIQRLLPDDWDLCGEF